MILYKQLSEHPRKHFVNKKKRAIVLGGTGATGKQLIKQLLESKYWEQITSIGRRPVLNGDTHEKLQDIIIDSFDQISSTKNIWPGHDIFFNCIGTTRSRAGGAKEFVNIELGISEKAAQMASKALIPHASIISAMGANPNQWSTDWIHPLLYTKTMGLKEQTLITNSFERISIFRPGMLVRMMHKPTWIDRIMISTNIALKVDVLASAMIRDGECNQTKKDSQPFVYIGNRCIKVSKKL